MSTTPDRFGAGYRAVLGIGHVRVALVAGTLLRVPIFGATIVLTLHVVQTLGLGFGAAGLATAVLAVAIAIAAPWRGRLLDRRGLRWTLAPSILVLAVAWSVAPFLSYPWLLALAVLGGLFEIPINSIVRQWVVTATGPRHQRSALALDAVSVELGYIAGPAVGVGLAALVGTTWTLVVLGWLVVLGGIVLGVLDLPLTGEDADPSPSAPHAPARSWVTTPAVMAMLAAAAATFVLSSSEVGAIAATRAMGEPTWLALVLALWGAGSIMGGLVYGALARPVAVAVLLAALALTGLAAVATSHPLPLALALCAAGLVCAPTLTAATDELTRVVAPARRGEAIGWLSGAMTLGVAAGAPLGGVVIDAFSWQASFVLAAVVGAGVALPAWLLRERRATADQRPGGSEVSDT